MERFQSENHLDSPAPDLVFFDVGFFFDITGDVSKDITTFSEFLDDAEALTCLIIEGFFVADQVGVLERGQNSDFIYRVDAFSFCKSIHLNFFHSVDLLIGFSCDSID